MPRPGWTAPAPHAHVAAAPQHVLSSLGLIAHSSDSVKRQLQERGLAHQPDEETARRQAGAVGGTASIAESNLVKESVAETLKSATVGT